MDLLFSGLHLFGTIGSGWVAYHHGYVLQNAINHHSIKPYKDKIGFQKESFFNEEMTCRLISTFAGLAVGRVCWYVTIPITLVFIEKKYGKSILQFYKKLK